MTQTGDDLIGTGIDAGIKRAVQAKAAGLKRAQGKCIINSISLKEGEEIFREHAKEARRFGTAVVVMAFDEHGQADTIERRVSVCSRAYKILTEEIGFTPQDIIFDPDIDLIIFHTGKLGG